MSVVDNLINWHLTEEIRTSGIDNERKAKSVVTFCLVLVFWAPMFSPLYYFIGSKAAAVGVIIAAILAYGIILILRKTGSAVLAANLLALCLNALVIFLAICTGGHGAPALMWLVSVPMLVVCTSRRLWGLIWTIVVFSEIVGFYLLDKMGVSFPQHVSAGNLGLLAFMALASLVWVVAALAWFYEIQRSQADEQLQRQTEIAAAAAAAASAAEATTEIEKKKAEELHALNQQLRASEQHLRAANQQLKGSQQHLQAVNQQLRAGEQYQKAANQQLAAKEQALQKSREELQAKVSALERFNKIMVGRELEMIKLKEQINDLLEESGKPKKYDAPARIKVL